MCAAVINVDVDQLPLVDLEARPDLCHHLCIELEFLLAQLVVAQLVVLQLAIEHLWIEDAHALGTGDVLAGLRRRQVGLDILFKIEELDVEGLHSHHRLHSGPLTSNL